MAESSAPALDHATSVCPRCKGETLFFALHPLGIPNQTDTTMTITQVCTECVSSFNRWWADA